MFEGVSCNECVAVVYLGHNVKVCYISPNVYTVSVGVVRESGLMFTRVLPT